MAGAKAVRILAAALAALASAPVAARERVAPHTENLRPCPEMGAGFVRVPGSATCIRASGRVVGGLDTRAGRGYDAAAAPVTAGQLSIDSRTESDYGPVRTFVRIGAGRR